MDKRVISINSADRDEGGTSDDFTITDDRQIFSNNPKSVVPLMVCIPYTWYNVIAESTGGAGDGSDQFAWTGASSGANQITIDSNNYTGESLATALAAAINAVAAPEVYTVAYELSTGKYTISSTESFTMDFTIDNNMATILGFNEEVTASATSHVSDNVAGFVTDKVVWVCTDMIDGCDNGIIPWRSGMPESYQIIAEVPIVGCFGSILFYQVPCCMPEFIMTNSLFSLPNPSTDTRTTRFYLRLPSGAPISLNGHEWSMQLRLNFNNPVSGH